MGKIKGWLVTNAFLNSLDKFKILNQRLLNSAVKKDIDLELFSNDALLVSSDGLDLSFSKREMPDFVLFMDKDIRLAQAMEQKGLRVFNSSKAIEICDDKSLTMLAVAGHKIKTPKTMLSPKTFCGVGYSNTDFLTEVGHSLGFPMVVKNCFGSFGLQVFLAKSQHELVKIVKEGEGPFLFQEFISSSYGRDLRINVVGNEVVASVMRINENDFRANVTNGGKMFPYEPTSDECKLALKVCEIIGTDFAGVDLLFGQDEIVFCEINSNAHIEKIFECTGIDVSEKMFEHILRSI